MSSSKPRKRHTPQRSCVVCRATLPKRQLTRLVSTPEGVQIDPTGKMAGRGAYLCSQPACWQSAARGAALSQALHLNLSDSDRERIATSAPHSGEGAV